MHLCGTGSPLADHGTGARCQPQQQQCHHWPCCLTQQQALIQQWDCWNPRRRMLALDAWLQDGRSRVALQMSAAHRVCWLVLFRLPGLHAHTKPSASMGVPSRSPRLSSASLSRPEGDTTLRQHQLDWRIRELSIDQCERQWWNQALNVPSMDVRGGGARNTCFSRLGTVKPPSVSRGATPTSVKQAASLLTDESMV